MLPDVFDDEIDEVINVMFPVNLQNELPMKYLQTCRVPPTPAGGPEPIVS
jgi:hypothetical protein